MSTITRIKTEIRPVSPGDLPLLEHMYETFSPVEVALGLPPRDPERRKAWLAGLQSGINLIALSDDRAAGHLALMPGANTAELAVFVHQDFRRGGIGTLLVDEALEFARKAGAKSIWVLISSDNVAARNGLLKYGFHTAWESLGEVKMEFPL